MSKRKPTKFTPSPAQIRYLKAYLSEKRVNKSKAAKEAGVDRSTVYQWRGKPEFVEWFNNEVKADMYASLSDVWKNVLRRSDINSNDSKLFLERFDKDYSEKKKIDLEGNINAQGKVLVSVVNITEDEKEVKE